MSKANPEDHGSGDGVIDWIVPVEWTAISINGVVVELEPDRTYTFEELLRAAT